MEGGKSMNKTLTQSISTVRAHDNFTRWLTAKMKETDTSEIELAAAIGVERKTIIAILKKHRSPKLDLVVKIFDYFDENWVQIPFYKEVDYEPDEHI